MSYVFDTHEDISDAMLYACHSDFFKRNGLHEGWNDLNLPVNNQSDFERLAEGDIRAIFAATCAIGVDAHGEIIPSEHHFDETLRHINLYHQLLRAKPQDIQLLLSKKDIDKISQFRLNFLLAIEGGDSIAENVDERLQTFFNLGIRSIGLTWSFKNDLATGCNFEGGITDLGREAIVRMNELGIVVDMAHLNEQSYYEILAVSSKPVLVSHTACRNVHPNPRNITDDQIRAVAEKGGVIGIAGVPKFIGELSIDRIADHILHAINIAGMDHVCIGSDLGSMTAPELIPNFEQVSDMPNFLDLLRRRGLSSEDIDKISHGNVERLLKEILPDPKTNISL